MNHAPTRPRRETSGMQQRSPDTFADVNRALDAYFRNSGKHADYQEYCDRIRDQNLARSTARTAVES